jgi:hypothetical protein
MGSATSSKNTGVDGTKFTVSWDVVSGATKYYIWRNTDDIWGGDGDYRIEVSAPTTAYNDTCTSTQSTSTYPTSNTTGGALTASGDILPSVDNTHDLGSASYRWANLYAATTTVGDLVFANQLRITEAVAPPEALIFENGSSTQIMKIDENGQMTVTKLVAEEIETEKLTVKDSPVSQTGITIYDRVTGEPYCIFMENGQMQTATGACSSTSTDSTSTSTDSTSTDSTSPETTIDSHPALQTTAQEAYFTFGSSDQYAAFQCKINQLDWEDCASPKIYSGLVPGDYQFQVYSADAYGSPDPTPAVFSWQIIESSDATTTDATTTDATTTDATTTSETANNPPVAQDLTATTTQNTAINITLTATDSDGDSLTFATTSSPIIGVLSGNTPNLTYTPNENATGTDSFTFKANDGTEDSNIATVSITISE